MTEPQITPAGEDQPMSEADRPPGSGEVAALAQEIATIRRRLAEVDETLSGCAGGFRRLDGQVAELAQLLADLSQDQEGRSTRMSGWTGAWPPSARTSRLSGKLVLNSKTTSMTSRRNSSRRMSGWTGAWAPSAATFRLSGKQVLNSEPGSMTSPRW